MTKTVFGKCPVIKGATPLKIHTLLRQPSSNAWLIREGRRRSEETEQRPCPLASIWDSSERPALLQGSLWVYWGLCCNYITFSLCPIPQPPQVLFPSTFSSKLPIFNSSCFWRTWPRTSREDSTMPHSYLKPQDALQMLGFSQRTVS